MKREKNEIKKESNECQYFTLHAWNGNDRKLNLQHWEPMLILWQILVGTEMCGMMTFVYSNDCRNNQCCCLPAQQSAPTNVYHNIRTASHWATVHTQSLAPNSNGLTLWGPKLAYIMHNNSVHTSKAAQCASIRNTDLLFLYMKTITRFFWSPMVTREPQFWPWVMATISLYMHKLSISEDINCLESTEKFELFKIYNSQTQKN